MSKQKKVRGWRKWHPSEAIGKVVVYKDGNELLALITVADKSGVVINGVGIGYDQLAETYEQLDGTPCGVWGWVKKT